jgi:hypothetical protein
MKIASLSHDGHREWKKREHSIDLFVLPVLLKIKFVYIPREAFKYYPILLHSHVKALVLQRHYSGFI